MSAINDGGPAFPIATEHVQTVADKHGNTVAAVSRNLGTYPGMSLRDWFAGMAITMVGEQCGNDPLMHGETPAEKYARQCYKMADAMLAARGEGA